MVRDVCRPKEAAQLASVTWNGAFRRGVEGEEEQGDQQERSSL